MSRVLSLCAAEPIVDVDVVSLSSDDSDDSEDSSDLDYSSDSSGSNSDNSSSLGGIFGLLNCGSFLEVQRFLVFNQFTK